VIDEERTANEDCNFVKIQGGRCLNIQYIPRRQRVPKSIERGLSTHQARRMKNGIQKRENWMLKSIARAFASSEGTWGLPQKYWRLVREKYT
jgi:hypothetical protein